ncbi:MAG: Molybdenum transport system permease protein ModB [Syntrophorhabdus sp. PtaB.Bin047]|nr:MAG: Molybdenum transport system permease protein ModB [Syntrophorhabdus sp. PtaB.Bin047]
MRRFVGSLFLVLAALMLCVVPVHAGDLSISVTASLREAVTELGDGFIARNPDVKIENDFAASGAFAKKIETGAAAARWYDTALTVIVPLSIRGIIGGSILMSARGLGEFGATIIVAGSIPGVTQTIPLAIYDCVSSPGGDVMAMALCLVSISISVVVLVFHEWLSRRMVRAD